VTGCIINNIISSFQLTTSSTKPLLSYDNIYNSNFPTILIDNIIHQHLSSL